VEVTARVVQGQPLYGPPSTDFTPWPYPPMYFWLTGLVARVIGLSLPPSGPSPSPRDGVVSGPVLPLEIFAAAAFETHLEYDHVKHFLALLPTVSTSGPADLVRLIEIPIPQPW